MITTPPQISPLVFLVGASTFLGAMLIHIQIWRAFPAARTISKLFLIFVICPTAIVLTLFLAGHIFRSPGSWFVRNPFNLLHVCICHLAMSAIYIMTYPAIQAKSPSLVLLLKIHERMPAGLDAEAIKGIFPHDSLLHARFDDLITDGLLEKTGKGYSLTATGRLLRTIFTTYRRILGLPVGEG